MDARSSSVPGSGRTDARVPGGGRTRHRLVRLAMWMIAVAVGLGVVIGGAVGAAIWRHTTVSAPASGEAEAEFRRLRARFAGRAPLVDIRDPGPIMADVRINRAPASAPRQRVEHFHVIGWDSRGNRLVRSRAPVWWMHFSGDTLLARLGVPVHDLTLTIEDVERYGPGIVLDFAPPGGGHLLVWVE